MTDAEKILELVNKNNGYITTKEVVENNLNKMALKRLCDGEILERIAPGYYSLPNIFNDEYYKIISRCKNAVFSHTTALYLHNLSDRTPLYFDITVPSGYGGVLQNTSNVSLHYVNNNLINLGSSTIKSPFGMNIKCYDMEKTICDIIKEKNHIDKEIYIKALKRYVAKKDKNLLNLAKYAKAMNIEKEVAEVMQVIM